MAIRKSSRSGRKKSGSGDKDYLRLEQRLLLLGWMLDLFGYKQNRELLSDAKNIQEGFNSHDGSHSHLYHLLMSRGEKLNISTYDLSRYDNNIRNHLRSINANRRVPITLRYFQHLALLFAEVYLDKFFHQPGELQKSLNRYVKKVNANRPLSEHLNTVFRDDDLKKLAFWMATGSGKTLIMHINYKQFLHYNNNALDNIILVTPNEGLSDQHLMELTTSGIPCRRFDLNNNGLFVAGRNEIQVIEITKLVEKKQGGGASVPVEAFEGNNLIFVDEGHKGSGGEAWRNYRDALGDSGFTFEYSATFGQALVAAKNEQLTEEYGKAILFDYSYRYFHNDGFGKDFYILNMKEEISIQATVMLLLGNLLSFYEQIKVYEDNCEQFRPYNLDKPLWVFVGSTVNAVYVEKKERRSDVLTVTKFLHDILQNRNGWVTEWIEALVQGDSGLMTPDGKDVFDGKFGYLRNKNLSPEKIYSEILDKVFHCPESGILHLCSIRGSTGEIGLKASSADDYFGLIYIGDTGRFKNLVAEDNSGIVLEEEVIAGSLFDNINSLDTTIDVLIGAKKFMEGWNSWRVSNMGLLNIGLNAGSAIIQLFGRGVRLRGLNNSLKRSAALDGSHSEHLGYLEVLNIFSLRANYMAKFRDYLENEGIDTEHRFEMKLRIKRNRELLKDGLVLPRLPDDRNFFDESNFILEPEKNSFIHVDLSYKVQTLASDRKGLSASQASRGEKRHISLELLDLIDWQKVYLELLEYRENKGYKNFAILPNTPRKIMECPESDNLYHLLADESVCVPKSFTETIILHETVITILKKYIDKFYRVRHKQWDSNHMIYQQLSEDDSIFQDYTVRVNSEEAVLISDIQSFIEDSGPINPWKERHLGLICFERHLYQPLLVALGEGIESTPPSLNEGERRLVEDLRKYWFSEKEKSLAGRRIYLLRNLGRSNGIGFFDKSGFFPDFILWIVNSNSQRIIFVEPHGMMHDEPYESNDKAKLYELLPELSRKINDRTKPDNIYLDSFIISVTPYSILQQNAGYHNWDLQTFSEKHILFFDSIEGYDYIAELLAPVNAF